MTDTDEAIAVAQCHVAERLPKLVAEGRITSEQAAAVSGLPIMDVAVAGSQRFVVRFGTNGVVRIRVELRSCVPHQ